MSVAVCARAMRRVTSVRKARSYVKAVKAVFNLAPACSSEKPRLSPEDPPTPHLKVVQMSINESRQGRYKSYVILAEIMHFHEHSRPRNSQRRFALRHPILFFFFINNSPINNDQPFLSFPNQRERIIICLSLYIPIRPNTNRFYRHSWFHTCFFFPPPFRFIDSRGFALAVGDARCYLAIPLNG